MELQTQKTGQTDNTGSGLDTALLSGAMLVLVAAVVAFYYYATKWALPVRLAVLFVGLAVCTGLTYQTALGKLTWAYLVGSRAEMRKVVWPNRQETVQTTLMIALVVVVVALLMWGLDSLLLFGIHQLTQRGN